MQVCTDTVWRNFHWRLHLDVWTNNDSRQKMTTSHQRVGGRSTSTTPPPRRSRCPTPTWAGRSLRTQPPISMSSSPAGQRSIHNMAPPQSSSLAATLSSVRRDPVLGPSSRALFDKNVKSYLSSNLYIITSDRLFNIHPNVFLSLSWPLSLCLTINTKLPLLHPSTDSSRQMKIQTIASMVEN